MASQAPDVMSTCLICFETRALKIVGNCKHSFCIECLSTVLGSHVKSESNTFACLSCKVECPRPWNGVHGLIDFKGTVDVVDKHTEHTVAPIKKEIESKEGDASCDLCDQKQAKVPAVNTCSECYHLHICHDCTKKHRQNKATKVHLLTPILTKRKQDPMCEAHHKPLLSFCRTCEEPVCVICVSLDHGDHDIERLADTIRSKVEEVKVMLREREEKLKDVQFHKKELTLLKEMAPVVDKQDILIKEIEDEAQKQIDHIVKCKEDLKRQVKLDYKVVRDIPVVLEKASETVTKMQEPINRANQLLSEVEPHPEYLDKLASLQRHLEVSAKETEDAEIKDYRADLIELHRNDRCFVSNPLTSRLGRLTSESGPHTLQLQKVFKHNMKVDSLDMYIPSIAILGSKYFAVAHPVKPGGLSDAIDIYEFPGSLKRTLRDHVPPIYDMTSTPDGKIAVLSDGTDGTSCSVKLFDAETGYISSTDNIGITKPISLGVTENQQYALLGKNQEGQIQIAITDTDGKQEYVIDVNKVRNPNMIACGGRFIFVKGESSVSVYKIRHRPTGLEFITVCSLQYINLVNSISATQLEDFFIVKNFDKRYYLDMYQDKKNQSGWCRIRCTNITKEIGNADKEIRLSTRDGDTFAMSIGNTIKVYKCTHH